ncbi:LAQU0S06e04742g1_1 [Lachancea quebecensis]|uniref:LAQU0S06e04742g1_1 n=1 Tax=Lachancea quebecensis TaxID=1654605 RepID=A0A0P1KRH6_9SACH|nr:LAQU0S06e04742g1_1 [Lachancea quebecensis]
MDGVGDILNENHVAEEEEEEDEELDEEMVDIAGRGDEQEQDQEDDEQDDQDEQDEQDEQDDDLEQSQDPNQDEDEDMDAEDDENDENDDNDDNPNEEGTQDTGGNGMRQDTEGVRNNGNGTLDGRSSENAKEKISRGPSAFEKIHQYYTQLHNSAKLADVYSIYPTAAIPIQTHVHSMAMSKGLKYLFLGGQDGYVRKFDFLNTIEGKLSLTILQKHSLVESISNAGILLSYWENEVPQQRNSLKLSKTGKEYEPLVSPVHAIDVQSECLFLLSGLENGGITMQGCRYMEGHIAHYFQKHTSTVNQLKINNDESRFISGGWDKQILEWDLNSGQCINEFRGSTAQLSSLEFRPLCSSVVIDSTSHKEEENAEDSQVKKDDDDLDSLFGDEEEEEKRRAQEGTQDLRSEDEPKSQVLPKDEISQTTLRTVYDENTFLASCTNGSLQIWDRRISTKPALNLIRGNQVPPWCMSACWSTDGDRIYAGRRNAVVEEYDLKMGLNPSKTLKFPSISGPVSCVRAMPNNKHVLCASYDNVRIYDVSQYGSSKVPFLIVPGHHGGMISNLYVDPTCRFLISTSGDRGWQGISTDATLIYDIDVE